MRWTLAFLIPMLACLPAQAADLSFTPQAREHAAAAGEYAALWAADGARIRSELERLTGAVLPDATIDVIVFEGVSHSGRSGEPMRLRASYTRREKQATLVHELAHRHVDELDLDPRCLGDVHALLSLVLAEAWSELWGEGFVREQAAVEARRSGRYRTAWKGVASLSRAKRVEELEAMFRRCPSRDARRALGRMLALDQHYRGENRREPWSAVAPRQEAIDRANLVRAERLIASHGWPRQSVVGEDAAMTAFLVVQHADVATQERYLPMLQQRYDEGEAKGAWLALLTDRILIAHGKPQRYRTQFRADPANGKTVPYEIEDPARLNERRASLGMKPSRR